jgi:thioredoxin-like negative regulator of GroEL
MSTTRFAWRRRRVSLGLFVAVLLLSAAEAGRAQEVIWRYDYASARREAVEKNRPILLDFGTEHCFWCVKLDSTTFRDPTIATILNERFIPLKVNAQVNPALTDALRIQMFPTIILAAPDGKILVTVDGYKDAAQFYDYLQRALVALSNPEWMTRDYEAAGKAIADSDYSRAIALLKSVVEDGKMRPIQVKAQQLLDDLEQQAANRLARARQFQDKGQSTEALESVTNLLKDFPGTQAAAEAGKMLKSLADRPEVKAVQRSRRARDLLAQAREDYRTQQYLCCLERCENLATNYPDLAEGGQAVQLANEIKTNPEWMRQACDALSERLGGLYLSLAESWLKKGQPQQAIGCLERVVQTLPGTRQAEAAQLRLSQLQGQPTQRANFKK